MCKLPWYFKLAYLFCWPAAVLADNPPTFSASSPTGDKVTLTAEPCTQHPWLQHWQVARWIWRGKPYDACWRLKDTPQGDKVVVVLDADGDIVSFDPTQFVKDEGI